MIRPHCADFFLESRRAQQRAASHSARSKNHSFPYWLRLQNESQPIRSIALGTGLSGELMRRARTAYGERDQTEFSRSAGRALELSLPRRNPPVKAGQRLVGKGLFADHPHRADLAASTR